MATSQSACTAHFVVHFVPLASVPLGQTARWYPSQCPRADAAGTNMLASRMDQRLSLFTQFTLWPLAAAIALHAPRASTLVGSTWKLKFDIGMEPGAAMADVE